MRRLLRNPILNIFPDGSLITVCNSNYSSKIFELRDLFIRDEFFVVLAVYKHDLAFLRVKSQTSTFERRLKNAMQEY